MDRIRGQQVESVYEVRQFDFDRQFVSTVSFSLKPNDTVRLSCYFDTTDATEPVREGLSARDEMCLVVLAYVTPVKLEALTNIYSVPVHSGVMADE